MPMSYSHSSRNPKSSVPAAPPAFTKMAIQTMCTTLIWEIASVIVFGPKYAPSNPSLVVTALQNLLDDAQQSMLDVNIHFNAFKQTLDNRHTLYERMCGEATRILAELRASGASSATIDKAKSYNNKIQGRRIKKVDPNAGEKTISASQTSFAQRFYHFDGLVGVCEHEPLYNPSEALLQIASLKAYLLQLKSANAAVATAKAQIAKARRDRNSTLYAPISGMVDTAIRVKEYTKAIFGFKSPEYRQIAHLKFRNLVKL